MLSECYCTTLRAADRHLTQHYDRALAPTGLRTTQYAILVRLRRLGPLAMHALAAELVIDRTTLTRTLRPLHRDKLLAITPSPVDGRGKLLALTAAGKTRLAAAERRWAIAQRAVDTRFGATRAAALRTLLRELIAAELA